MVRIKRTPTTYSKDDQVRKGAPTNTVGRPIILKPTITHYPLDGKDKRPWKKNYRYRILQGGCQSTQEVEITPPPIPAGLTLTLSPDDNILLPDDNNLSTGGINLTAYDYSDSPMPRTFKLTRVDEVKEGGTEGVRDEMSHAGNAEPVVTAEEPLDLSIRIKVEDYGTTRLGGRIVGNIVMFGAHNLSAELNNNTTHSPAAIEFTNASVVGEEGGGTRDPMRRIKNGGVVAKRSVVMLRKSDVCALFESDVMKGYNPISREELIRRKLMEGQEDDGLDMEIPKVIINIIPKMAVKKDPKRVSNGSAEIACKVCPKTFTTYPNYKQHMMTVHYRIFKFSCPICGEGLPQARDIYGHLSSKHGYEKHFSCEKCGDKFHYARNVTQHAPGGPGCLKKMKAREALNTEQRADLSVSAGNTAAQTPLTI